MTSAPTLSLRGLSTLGDLQLQPLDGHELADWVVRQAEPETAAVLAAVATSSQVTRVRAGTILTAAAAEQAHQVYFTAPELLAAVDDLAVVTALGVTGWRYLQLPQEQGKAWVDAATRCARVHPHSGLGLLVNRWVQQGNDPRRLLALVEAVESLGVDEHRRSACPWRYGLGVTREQFVALHQAGVRTIDVYAAAGCSLDEAANLAASNVPEGAALLAARLGVPRSAWVEVFGGWGEWVRTPDLHGEYADNARKLADWDPVERSLLGHGWTVDDLTFLAQNGWGDMTFSDATNGRRARAARSCTPAVLTATLARECITRGISVSELAAWTEAVTTGSVSNRVGGLPALLRALRGTASPELLDQITWLTGQDVRPAHIVAFRKAGCRTIEDVMAAVRAGISGPVAAHLTTEYGRVINSSRGPRLASVKELIETWQRYQAGDEDE